MSIDTIIWLLVAITLMLWVVGLAGGAGGLIHLLFLAALLMVLYNLFAAPRPTD